jgi:hypothetical protein
VRLWKKFYIAWNVYLIERRAYRIEDQRQRNRVNFDDGFFTKLVRELAPYQDIPSMTRA